MPVPLAPLWVYGFHHVRRHEVAENLFLLIHALGNLVAVVARDDDDVAGAVHDGIVARNPCSRRTSPGMGKQRPYVATTRQIWALYDSVPIGTRVTVVDMGHQILAREDRDMADELKAVLLIKSFKVRLRANADGLRAPVLLQRANGLRHQQVAKAAAAC